MKRLMTGLILMAVLAGCASTPKLTPKASADDVQVFYPNTGVNPPADYKVYGPLKLVRPLSTPDAEIVAELRAEAARLGADGIIVQQIRRGSEGSTSGNVQDDRKIGEAIAIYWTM